MSAWLNDGVLPPTFRYVPGATTQEKLKANSALNRAVKAGRVTKPCICERCGKAKPRLHGHHNDYSKPLDVVWLCPLCHKFEHERINTILGWVRVNTPDRADSTA